MALWDFGAMLSTGCSDPLLREEKGERLTKAVEGGGTGADVRAELGRACRVPGWELQNPRHCWHGVQPTVQGERRRGAGDALIWNVPSCIWVSSITVIAFMGTLQYYISRWNTKWVYLGPGY